MFVIALIGKQQYKHMHLANEKSLLESVVAVSWSHMLLHMDRQLRIADFVSNVWNLLNGGAVIWVLMPSEQMWHNCHLLRKWVISTEMSFRLRSIIGYEWIAQMPVFPWLIIHWTYMILDQKYHSHEKKKITPETKLIFILNLAANLRLIPSADASTGWQ